MFLEEYTKLTEKCAISKLGEKFTFYYADNNDVQVLARDCIELDIRSAFPTICKLMFGEDDAFVKEIFKKETKIEKVIYISTNIKKIKREESLKTLNNYCKLFIFGKVFNDYDNITILEYKKDGILFNGELREESQIKNVEDLLNKHKIEFKQSSVETYFRFNMTSIYEYEDNKIEIKGILKDCPEFLIDEIFPNLLSGEINNSIIKKVYSNKYYEILKQNGLRDKINYYYAFGENNNKFLNNNGKLEKISLTNINPNQVLIHFLYPMIGLLRNE